MSRSGRNIYKRKDGRWEGRYVKGRKIDGTIKYGYVYRRSQRETKQALDMYKQFYAPKKNTSQPLFELTFREWTPIWLKQVEYTVKPTTYSNYNYKIERYILPFFKHCFIHEISTELIYEFIENLKELSLSVSSIHSIFQLFKQCLKAALLNINCDDQFLTQIKLPKRNNKKIGALSLNEQKRLTATARKEPMDKGLPVILALHTGMRIGEISALEWSDIDFNKNTIYVNKTCQRIFQNKVAAAKTYVHIDTAKSQSSNRVIPITPYLGKLLRKYSNLGRKTKWVFSIHGRPCEPRLLTSHFHTIRQKANLSHIHFHQLRHTFATRCLEALSDIPTVSALLGHRSSQLTLDIYSDVLIEQRMQTIQKVAKYIS